MQYVDHGCQARNATAEHGRSSACGREIQIVVLRKSASELKAWLRILRLVDVNNNARALNAIGCVDETALPQAHSAHSALKLAQSTHMRLFAIHSRYNSLRSSPNGGKRLANLGDRSRQSLAVQGNYHRSFRSAQLVGRFFLDGGPAAGSRAWQGHPGPLIAGPISGAPERRQLAIL